MRLLFVVITPVSYTHLDVYKRQPQLCTIASEVSKTVTAVDFAQDMIKVWRHEGIKYICAEWNHYFEQTADTFDTILTDGGLTCIEYPDVWRQLANNLAAHLRPDGIFAVRAFLNTEKPTQDSYDNPNLNRFVAGMSRVDSNWMRQIRTHENYKNYDVRYAFPRLSLIHILSNVMLPMRPN